MPVAVLEEGATTPRRLVVLVAPVATAVVLQEKLLVGGRQQNPRCRYLQGHHLPSQLVLGGLEQQALVQTAMTLYYPQSLPPLVEEAELLTGRLVAPVVEQDQLVQVALERQRRVTEEETETAERALLVVEVVLEEQEELLAMETVVLEVLVFRHPLLAHPLLEVVVEVVVLGQHKQEEQPQQVVEPVDHVAVLHKHRLELQILGVAVVVLGNPQCLPMCLTEATVAQAS